MVVYDVHSKKLSVGQSSSANRLTTQSELWFPTPIVVARDKRRYRSTGYEGEQSQETHHFLCACFPISPPTFGMLKCGHVQDSKQLFGWFICKPKQFWETTGQVEKMELEPLIFRPETKVCAVIKTCGSISAAEFSVEADGEDVNDLNCSLYLWKDNDVCGSKGKGG
ncbi:hypothetical protein M3Y98_00714900 [Aphelenchoides besseyi]|nr:hypothetical protein M3Y98_00714900 [Aphelenchoides besseyi]